METKLDGQGPQQRTVRPLTERLEDAAHAWENYQGHGRLIRQIRRSESSEGRGRKPRLFLYSRWIRYPGFRFSDIIAAPHT